MAEQKIRETLGTVSLSPADANHALEQLVHIRGAIMAANKLGHEVCADVKFQALPESPSVLYNSTSIEFFVYLPDRRRER